MAPNGLGVRAVRGESISRRYAFILWTRRV